MKSNTFKALMMGHIFVDGSLLGKGIYETLRPELYSEYETIEKLVERAEKVRDMFGEQQVPKSYIENLKKCRLQNVKVEILEDET